MQVAQGKLGKRTSNSKTNEITQLVKMYTKCPITNKPLEEPIVSDWRGHLYSKEAVIGELLQKKGRFKSLNDVIDIKIRLENGKLTCPLSGKVVDLLDDDVTLQELQFSYIVPCGCAMNTKVLRDLNAVRCPLCHEPFDQQNIIDINGNEAELQKRMDTLMEKRLYHNLKERKRKKTPEDKVSKKRKVL